MAVRATAAQALMMAIRRSCMQHPTVKLRIGVDVVDVLLAEALRKLAGQGAVSTQHVVVDCTKPHLLQGCYEGLCLGH